MNNDDLQLKQYSNFTILSKHGVGVLVSEFRGSLQLTITSFPERTVRCFIKLNVVQYKMSKTLKTFFHLSCCLLYRKHPGDCLVHQFRVMTKFLGYQNVSNTGDR